MQITLTKRIDGGFSGATEFIKFKTDTNHLVAFWGEDKAPNRNIAALKDRQLPVKVEIADPEACMPTKHEKHKYKLMLSVPSHVGIFIDPEF